jgi:protein-glutamine gamma-glutamyltransferase
MMTTPPGLIGATLLFWGWQTGVPELGAIAGLVLEGSRCTRGRWEFSSRDFNRVWDLCVLIFLGAAFYFYSSEDLAHSAFGFFRGLPLVFLPMMAAQVYGNQETMRKSTFSFFLRRNQSKFQAEEGINISYPYFGICLISTSASNQRGNEFFVGMVLLMGWALWANRPRRFPGGVWLGLLAGAVGVGHVGNGKLQDVQAHLESRASEWFSRFGSRGYDPTESRTSMGHIGGLQNSGKIVMWVRPGEGSAPPALLRQASYDMFKQVTWTSGGNEFSSVSAEIGGMKWRLLPQKRAGRVVEIWDTVDRKPGLLSLPHGTAVIEELPVTGLEKSGLGAVRAFEGPGAVRFRARYEPGESIDLPPEITDLMVPENEEGLLKQIVVELGLSEPLTVEEKLGRIAAFFQEDFQYSTYVPGNVPDPYRGESPLKKFLAQTRAGHCEYFATATVLLLRQAGIPARYATGYSVQEKRGNRYVVREWHAHAWAMAYVDGYWEEFDTTPPDLLQANRSGTLFGWLRDQWSQVRFQVSWGWAVLGKSAIWEYGFWLLIPGMGVVVWRLFSLKRARGFPLQKEKKPATKPGIDSEFYLVEQKLTRLGFARHPGETLGQWLQRIESTPQGAAAHCLKPVLALHYRYRFDPAGLSAGERQELKQGVQQWFANVGQN